MFKNCEIPAKACNLFHAQLRLFVTRVSKLNLLLNLILKSFLLLLFLMTSLSISIENGSSLLKIRLNCQDLPLRNCLETFRKYFSLLPLVFSRVTSTFP